MKQIAIALILIGLVGCGAVPPVEETTGEIEQGLTNHQLVQYLEPGTAFDFSVGPNTFPMTCTSPSSCQVSPTYWNMVNDYFVGSHPEYTYIVTLAGSQSLVSGQLDGFLNFTPAQCNAIASVTSVTVHGQASTGSANETLLAYVNPVTGGGAAQGIVPWAVIPANSHNVGTGSIVMSKNPFNSLSWNKCDLGCCPSSYNFFGWRTNPNSYLAMNSYQVLINYKTNP